MTRDEALQAAIVRLQKADEALDADPTTDIAYRHRENAKLYLAAAGHFADIERQQMMLDAGQSGFLSMLGAGSPFQLTGQLTPGPIETGTYGGEEIADDPEPSAD